MLTLKYPSNLASEYQGIPFIDLRGKLPVNPHYTWAQLAGIRPADTLNTIVCHHDALKKSSTSMYPDVELARRIAQAHINSKKNHLNGDAGFPYDVWIRNGKIYWCNDIEPREYGVAGNNGYTVNVCVSGDYENYDSLSDADRRALYVAIIMMRDALPNDQYIKGHKELQATACPGYDMTKVRADIDAIEYQRQLSVTPNTQLAEVVAAFARLQDVYSTASKPGKYQNYALGLFKPVIKAMNDTKGWFN